jgi:hypothetical protein
MNNYLPLFSIIRSTFESIDEYLSWCSKNILLNIGNKINSVNKLDELSSLTFTNEEKEIKTLTFMEDWKIDADKSDWKSIDGDMNNRKYCQIRTREFEGNSMLLCINDNNKDKIYGNIQNNTLAIIIKSKTNFADDVDIISNKAEKYIDDIITKYNTLIIERNKNIENKINEFRKNREYELVGKKSLEE